MLTISACSETALFKEYSKQDFHSLYILKQFSYDNHHAFFPKYLELDVDSRNGTKNSGKFFRF